MLNRVGAIQVHSDSGTEVVADWQAVLEASNPHQVVKLIERRSGIAAPLSTPGATARTISYRFLATTLTMLFNERHRWDVRSEYVDSSSMGPSRARYIEGFSDVDADLVGSPRIGIPGEPYSHYWAIRRGGATAAVVSIEGRVFRPGKKPASLLDAYEASGRRFVKMAVNLLQDWL